MQATFRAAGLAAGWLLAAHAPAAAQPVGRLADNEASRTAQLSSPDGRIEVRVQWPAPATSGRPRWSATFQSQPVLAGCGLGLQATHAGDLMAGARVTQERRRTVSERVPMPFGKADHAENHFQEVRYTTVTPQGDQAGVVFRCYSDAIALRYELPARSRSSCIAR